MVQLTGVMGESGSRWAGPDIIIQAVQFLALLGTNDIVISNTLGSSVNGKNVLRCKYGVGANLVYS